MASAATDTTAAANECTEETIRGVFIEEENVWSRGSLLVNTSSSSTSTITRNTSEDNDTSAGGAIPSNTTTSSTSGVSGKAVRAVARGPVVGLDFGAHILV